MDTLPAFNAAPEQTPLAQFLSMIQKTGQQQGGQQGQQGGQQSAGGSTQQGQPGFAQSALSQVGNSLANYAGNSLFGPSQQMPWQAADPNNPGTQMPWQQATPAWNSSNSLGSNMLNTALPSFLSTLGFS
jgi:hypothetical protein